MINLNNLYYFCRNTKPVISKNNEVIKGNKKNILITAVIIAALAVTILTSGIGASGIGLWLASKGVSALALKISLITLETGIIAIISSIISKKIRNKESLPLFNKNKFNTFFIEKSKVDLKDLKSGQIAFVTDPGSRTQNHKMIHAGQVLRTFASQNSRICHAFIILNVEGQIVRIAEASGSKAGLKESILDFNKLNDDAIIYICNPKDEKLAEQIKEVAKFNVDPLDSQEIEPSNNIKNLYNKNACVRSFLADPNFKDRAKHRLAYATVDFLKGDQFKTATNNIRKSYMCSYFAGICFQVALLIQNLSKEEKKYFKELGRDMAAEELTQKIDEINLKQHLFSYDAGNIMPSALALTMGINLNSQ